MKFTLSWLKSHLQTDASLGQITDTLTQIGLELEAVENRGVRATTAIFEDRSMKVQRIDHANDIGRDLLVDLIDESGYTGEVIALQVKSGAKYKRSHGYAIPCSDKDAQFWRDSTVPIFGVVYDDDLDQLFWVNLSEWARDSDHPEPPTTVPVPPA